MNNSVLVLNQDFSPLMVCSIQRAFVMVYLNKSEMIKPARNSWLRTVTRSFAVPSVIRLTRYARVPYRGINLTRQNVFRRDSYQCQYCDRQKDLTLDHVIPLSKGGGHTWSNLVTACKKCNTKKGNHTPEEASMLIKRIPSRPSYMLFLRRSNGLINDEWSDFLN